MHPVNSQDADILADVIRARRTIERFREECPPKSTIVRAIELACWAPNHKHTQPWRFHLLGPDARERLVALNTRLVREKKGAAAAAVKQERWSLIPGWLALTSVLSEDPLRTEEDYAACCCAAQNLALYLWSCGVGMKWGTGPVTRCDEFSRILGLEVGERKVVGLFAYGYPASVPESRRSPVQDVLVECP
jgi:nitroreductase